MTIEQALLSLTVVQMFSCFDLIADLSFSSWRFGSGIRWLLRRFTARHQIFTRVAAERIGEGLGSFVVEASAALSILIYLAILWLGGRWNQKFIGTGLNYSLLTASA
jgi:hypothetical protein